METDNSDFIDSDTEAYLYSQIHHNYQPQSNCDNNNRTEEQDVMTHNAALETVSSEAFTLDTVLSVDRTTLTTKPVIHHLAKDTGLSRTITNDLTSFPSLAATPSEKNKPAPKYMNTEKRRVVNYSTTGVSDSNCSIFGVPTVTIQNMLSKPTVKVLTDVELRAERQNRRQSLLEKLSFPSKCVSKKRKLVMQSESKNSDDSLDSSEDDMKNWPQSGNHKVVINIGASTDCSGPVKAEQEDKDLSLWEVSQEDRFNSPRSKDKKMYLVCYNCRERGHLSKSCKKPKRLVNCFLCGQPGHKGERCKSPMCSKCLLPGHWYYQCYWSPQQVPPCPLCHTKGHLCQQCPSIWRRYHLTTAAGPVVSVSKYDCRLEQKTPYCYSCGHGGHYGYDCTRSKKNNYTIPVNRVVSDYNDPRKVLLNPVNTKLWRKKLKLACIPYSQDSAEHNLVPAKKHKQMQLFKRSKKKKKKVRAQSGNATGDIVRIDPISERCFPRTKKKTKKQIVLGGSPSFLKNVRKKSSKNKFNRNTRNLL